MRCVSRPTQYTAELAAAICERLAQGESLVQICADESFPHRQRVHEWIDKHEEFARQYNRAREDQADHYADEIIEIADNEPDSNRARERVDARKWVAAKLKPKRYGERTTLEHEGQVTQFVVEVPPTLDVNEWLETFKPSGAPDPDRS